MADHVRKQLREAVATLVTNLTTTGANVFQSRSYVLQENELPCLVVTTDGDRVDNITMNHPAQQQRETQVRIDAYARATTNLDDTIDLICKEVEIAIAGASTTLVEGLMYNGCQIDTEVLGNQSIGKASMVFSKDLYTVSNAPDVLIG
jgi:hypothetical protein